MAINIRRNYERDETPSDLMSRFEALENSGEEAFVIQVASHLVALNVREDDRHWWSPELSLSMEDLDSGTRLYEVIGPNPSIFTLAMFFIILGGVGFIASATWAFSLMSVGESSVLAWVVNFLSGGLIGTTFAILAIGRIKAADQVACLRTYLAEILG